MPPALHRQGQIHTELRIDPATLTLHRHRIGAEVDEATLAETIDTARLFKLIAIQKIATVYRTDQAIYNQRDKESSQLGGINAWTFCCCLLPLWV